MNPSPEPESQESGPGRALPRLLAGFALLALAVFPYLPGATFGFVYDDHGAIVENPFLAAPANLRRVLTLEVVRDPQVLDGQRPVLLLSLFLDRAGSAVPQPWRHHASNLLLHAAAVGLLFQLVRRLGGGGRTGDRVALVAALVLALHPAWSEAVQLPSYREDLLALVFVLAYLLADFLPARAGRWAAQLPALALAVASKESAWVAPLLLAWMRLCAPAPGRRAADLVAPVVAGLALVAAYAAWGYAGRPVQASGGSWNGLSLRWPDNLWTAPWLFVRYAGLFAWPQSLVADRVVEAVPQPWDPRCLAGLAGGLAALAAGLRLRRPAPLAAFGAGWLLLAFAPVSNLAPLLNPMADRYLYGLAPGFGLLFASFVVRGSGWRRVALVLLVLAWVLQLQGSLMRWRDDETLWTVTSLQEPRSARAQTWLGLIAKQHGDRPAARAYFERAEALNPHDVSALVNLAILAGEAGDLASAEQQLREALRRRPEHPAARANLAVALAGQGRLEEAAALQDAVPFDPRSQ